MPRLAGLPVIGALLLLGVAGIATNRTHAQEGAEALIARIERPQIPDRQGFDGLTLQELMQRLRVPGVSIAAVWDFQIHWSKAYGAADAETGRALNTDTRLQAASISKPVAALAAMRLVQERRLDLDADVNTILKSWRVPSSDLTSTRPVTPRALLSHTSGSDDGFGFPGYNPSVPVPTLVQILDGQAPSNVGKVAFARSPFQAYKYSGGGITIMQLALMDLTSQPFAEFMKSMVLDPLQMTGSSFEQPPPAGFAEGAARAHNAQGRPMPAPWRVHPEQAAAGLWTTATDLAKFIVEIQTAVRGPAGRILDQSTVREMVSPVGVGPYAIGLAIEKRGEGWYFSHGGSNWGFRAEIVGHLRKGYGAVIMTNGENGSTLINELRARIAAAYGWDSLDKPIVR